MAKKMSFEDAMKRLDEIVALLEKNEESLDNTIKLYEEGLELVKYCDLQLKQFNMKIEEITKGEE